MFTGIIERTGTVKGLSSNKLEVRAGSDFSVRLGDSVCVSGVCLTVSNISGDNISFDVSHESLSVATLKDLKVNDVVNLERAMPADGRFGGHFVTGHVDSVGKISRVTRNGNDSIDMFVSFDKEYSPMLVDKGSVAINGVSLTVNEVNNDEFRLTLIPYTLKETDLTELRTGDAVNIEFDVLAKYVLNMLKGGGLKTFNVPNKLEKPMNSSLTEEKLRSLGYVK